MLKHCSDSWSLFSFSPQSDRQLTDRSAHCAGGNQGRREGIPSALKSPKRPARLRHSRWWWSISSTWRWYWLGRFRPS